MVKVSDIPVYEVKFHEFSDYENKLLEDIRSKIIDSLLSKGEDFNIDENVFQKQVENYLRSIGFNDVSDLSNKIVKEILGYGKIDSMIKDDDLEEIMILGINKPVYVFHRTKGMMSSNVSYSNDAEIRTLIESIARTINRSIDQQSPILDARLIDGSRVNATIPPISADGSTLTIRKFKKDPLTIVDLINFKTLNSYLAAFLWLSIDGMGVNPANIIIAGGTSSGKTTTLNSLSNFINPIERIVTIEDTLELQINHENIIRMETRPPNIENKGEINMDALLKNSLRQRPDRIIVGEVRGNEAITLFTSLNTGHSGFGTLHANSSRETITRLINPPMNVPQIMISAIDFIIIQNRIYGSSKFSNNENKSVRRITEVSEVVGIEEGTTQLNKIFQWNPKTDDIEFVGISSKVLNEISGLKGVSLSSLEDEIKKRQFILDFLSENKIRDVKSISDIINAYYFNPDKTIEKLLDSKGTSL